MEDSTKIINHLVRSLGVSAHQATAFVTEAVEALMYLGCDVLAQ